VYAVETYELCKAFEKTPIKKRLIAALTLRKAPSEKVIALNKVSFKVRKGEIFGFLGPNGAGKTTTVKILTTILIPDSGEARVLGFDVVRESLEVRRRIGVLPEDSQRGFGWRLTAFENLYFYATAYLVPDPKRRVREVLELVGLEKEHWNKWFQRLSQGMKQKVAIARALIPDPEVVFLDEPTKGLDILFVAKFREMVRDRFGDKSRAVFLSTHDMRLVEETCDRVALINKGRIIAVKPVEELKRLVPKGSRNVYVIKVNELSGSKLEKCTDVLKMFDLEWFRVERRRIEFQVKEESIEAANEVLKTVLSLGVLVESFGRREIDIEEIIRRLLEEEGYAD